MRQRLSDCFAVGPGFRTLEKVWMYVNVKCLRGMWNSKSSNRKSSRKFGGRPLTTPQGDLPQNWGEMEPKHTVPCMVLKVAANDRRKLAPCLLLVGFDLTSSIRWQ
ncbi:hypothetical protein TNCV_1844231 [Trichonephila clavipes]|nr:hypothetical protein TNCV_1844231 [Trichonephila clavipes]